MPDGSVILVEMFGPRLTRVTPDGTKETIAEIAGGPNGAAIGPDGALYLCNNGGCFTPGRARRAAVARAASTRRRYIGGRIQRVDLATGAVTDLYTECDGRPLRAPNDLVFDAHGGFWFTDHGIRDGAGPHQRPDRHLLRQGRRQPHQRAGPSRSKRPTASACRPTASTLYWAETLHRSCVPAHRSPRRACWRRPRPLDPSVCLAGLPGYQLLDSLAVDGDGNVCVATLVNGGITVISPDGVVDRAHPHRRPADHQHLLRRPRRQRRVPRRVHHRLGHAAGCCTCAGRTAALRLNYL